MIAMKLVPSRWLFVSLCLLPLACGSGEQSLTLVVDPPTLAADGESLIELAATVVFRGDELPDGKRVTFVADAPVLFESREDATPEVVGGRQTGNSEVDAETRSGRARVYLLAPIAAGNVKITASYTTVNKDVLSDDATIALLPPPLVLSARGNGSQGNTINFFEFSCERSNVGGFVADRDEIRVPCTVRLRDATGRELHHVPIVFYTEAGEMQVTEAMPDTPRSFTYVVPTTLSEKPRDVRPMAQEESEHLVDIAGVSGIEEFNPRDGLVTILACVRGQEGFVDGNQNNAYDAGEQFLDEGEPFQDFDDDGSFDAANDSPIFCDSNGNGRVDGMNGKYDSDIYLGRMVHILWTGELDYNEAKTFMLATPVDIPAAAQAEIKLRLTDMNFNPLASNKSTDALDFSLLNSKARLIGDLASGTVLLEGTTGMDLRDQFPTFLFGDEAGPVFVDFLTVNGALRGREWTPVVADARTGYNVCAPPAGPGPAAWELTVDVSYTVAPSYSGGSFSALEGSKSVSGQLLALPASDAACQ